MDAFSGTPPTPPYSIPPSAAAAASSVAPLPNAANPSDAGNPAAAARALFVPLRELSSPHRAQPPPPPMNNPPPAPPSADPSGAHMVFDEVPER
jgi:hypothetical protein